MTLERSVHPALRTMLMANEPFEYAHLIKFERPSRPDSRTGKVSTAGVRYTYLTDASRDIIYDDGSRDNNNVLNGPQTYIANKVLRVSEVSESIEAKASNFTVTVDGNGLGAELGAQPMTVTSVSAGIWDIQVLNTNVDPVYEGFREGDKVNLYGDRTGSFNIVNFRANNVIRVKKIDTDLTTGANLMLGIQLASEEIKSILLDKNAAQYASFVNREVFIYRIYEQNGTKVGEPILLFKGIISNVSFDDNDDGIVVSWGLTSHWGDFAQVRGRISSDDFHRALDQNGNPQPASTLKVEYAYDKGFMHSETSLNMLAKYIVQVEKQKIKVKKGFLGIGSKVKVKKYFVDEDRFTELDFQLQSRAIPLHYGVRITEGFPIFADTLYNDSSTVYVIYALGEGPIGAIYDILIDDKSLICLNQGDLDARGAQTATNTVDIICRGRADRGDVLGGQTSIDYVSAPIDYYSTAPTSATSGRGGFFGALINEIWTRPYIPPTTTSSTSNGKGVIDGESISLTSPIDMTLDFFGGGPGQKASTQLSQLALNNSFKVQRDYWTGVETDEYWGPNHRLLDTAYVLAKFKIAEGEETIPGLEFIIRGKAIECYNYDYSYTHYDKNTSENPDNFALGSIVDLKRSDTNAVINNSVQIIDKWTFTRIDGSVETRFRFSSPPNLNYVNGVPGITKFYMHQGANFWTMTTFNFVEDSGTLDYTITDTSTPNTSGPGGTVVYPITNPIITVAPNPVISQPGGTVLAGGSMSGGGLSTRYAGGTLAYQ